MLSTGDSLGLTGKPESSLGLMSLGCITNYLQEALIDQVTIVLNFYLRNFNCTYEGTIKRALLNCPFVVHLVPEEIREREPN